MPTGGRYRPTVIGTCYLCGGVLRPSTVARKRYYIAGRLRPIHRTCEDRVPFDGAIQLIQSMLPGTTVEEERPSIVNHHRQQQTERQQNNGETEVQWGEFD